MDAALYDTDAWSLFPALTPVEEAPAEAAQPEVTWFSRLWAWFRNLSIFDPGAIVMILVWVIFWWVFFR